MCDVFCSFFSSYNCLWFELSEVFKDFQFEADLPSSAPVYVLFWLDGLSLFDFLSMSVSLGFVPIWVRKRSLILFKYLSSAGCFQYVDSGYF